MSRITFVIVGILIIVAGVVFLKKMSLLFIGLGVIIAILPFLLTYLVGVRKEKEKEAKFLEFIRELAESVKAGTPITQSIVAISKKDFGSLTPHIDKLANQISFSIPLKQALRTLAAETKSRVISRTIELIIQAETSGGNIGDVLESAVKAVSEIEKINKERKSQVYGMIVQGYVIFLIFIAIMLFVQLKFLPLISQAMVGVTSSNALMLQTSSFKIIKNTFFYLVLIQAAFAGLVIGKLSEGSLKYGVKHSAILIAISYLLVAVSKIIG